MAEEKSIEPSTIDLRQDRRNWLKTSAAAIGASLLPLPAIAQEKPQAADATQAPAAPKAAEVKSAAHIFTPAQHRLVDELTETIIPADDHSGGAKAAKVADYIDEFLARSFDDTQKNTWREGLRLIEIMAQHYNGKTFVDSSPDERHAVLKVLSDNDRMVDLPEVRFFIELKRLTVRGYYTSKIGIHDDLQYKGNRILQEFVGCDDPTPQ
jgi:hypothetical protein